MKFQSTVIVTGMKASKGQMESGQSYDSTKVFVETPLDDSRGTAKGSATADYTLGLSDEYNKFKHLSFPFSAEATFEIVTSGRVQKTVLTSLKPLESPAKKVA